MIGPLPRLRFIELKTSERYQTRVAAIQCSTVAPVKSTGDSSFVELQIRVQGTTGPF